VKLAFGEPQSTPLARREKYGAVALGRFPAPVYVVPGERLESLQRRPTGSPYQLMTTCPFPASTPGFIETFTAVGSA
jgi:hypothetical protein